jgi:hypothetical protein
MSKQDQREIEEGEIVEDDDRSIEDDEEDFSDDDVDVDDDEEEMVYDDDDEIPDVTDLLGSVLMTPDGDTVCSALCAIAQEMNTQNKILIKILSKLS